MKNKRVVILGSGPGGYTAALQAALQGGSDVTLIEAKYLGGVCLNCGCIPSKVMKNSADLLGKIKNAQEFGIIGAEKAEINLKAVLARQEKVIDILAKGINSQLARSGVKRINGYGSFTDGGKLQVAQDDGQIKEIGWDKVILATGSSPLELPKLKFDHNHILSSTDLLKLDSLPSSLVIAGGGVIGCEFAFIFNALGCRITIVEGLERILPLPDVDFEVSKVLIRQMKKRGIAHHLNYMVDSAKVSGDCLDISLSKAKGAAAGYDEIIKINAEKILICVGRQPNSSGLGLEKIGVETDDKGWILVDEYLQTSNQDVLAVGDAIGPSRPMLAHVAIKEGRIAANNLFNKKIVSDYTLVPSVVFTEPEIGCAGLSEEQAKNIGMEVQQGIVQFRSIGKAHAIGEIDGMLKIIADKKSGRIAGVHIIGPHASDLIAEGVLAMKKGCSMKELSEIIHAHPTLAEAMMEAAS